MKAFAIALFAFAAFVAADVYFDEKFDSEDWSSRWVQSTSRSDYGTFKWTAGKFFHDEAAEKGIQTSQDYRFYALSSAFTAFSNEGKELIFQFTVKHEQKIDCGGGYLKLLPAETDLSTFNGDAKYFVMFGPDICGYGTRRIHLIFHYNGQNLLWKKEPKPETDELTHAYTLRLFPNNTYSVAVDGKVVESGNLAEDWDFLKPRTIQDPAASKPQDWVDEASIADPEDVKPEDWDNEPATIPDPDAKKPEDWDDENDGEWEAPVISNPNFKGEWKPRMIPNPAYKGPWVHPTIPNPDFVEDDKLYRFEAIGAVAVDIWQVKAGSIFDNILVTDDAAVAQAFVDTHLAAIQAAEKKLVDEAEEKRRKEEEEERRKVELEEAAEKEKMRKEGRSEEEIEAEFADDFADDHDHDHDHDHGHGHGHDEL